MNERKSSYVQKSKLILTLQLVTCHKFFQCPPFNNLKTPILLVLCQNIFKFDYFRQLSQSNFLKQIFEKPLFAQKQNFLIGNKVEISL